MVSCYCEIESIMSMESSGVEPNIVQLEPQELSLPVHNYDSTSTMKSFTRHSSLFNGTSKRGLIVGPSGCGKTNALLTLLLHSNGLRFKNIYICCRSLYQQKYEYLRNVLNSVPEIGYFEYNDVNDMLTPEQVSDYSVIIFDDIPPIDLNIVKQFFSYGRHRNLDCFYLVQTYSVVPKQLIRDNVNLLIVYRQDGTNLKHIYNDHIHDLSYDKFLSVCRMCWKNSYGMLFIDKDSAFNDGRYRLGFDTNINLLMEL